MHSYWSMGLLKEKPLMSIVMNFALGVGRMQLKRHMAVVMSAEGVLTSPVYWMRLPHFWTRRGGASVGW